MLLMKGEVKQEYYFVGEVKFTKLEDAARMTTVTIFFATVELHQV